MKYIVLIIGLLVVGCGKTAEEKVVGTYEAKIGEDAAQLVFLENGTVEGYKNGKKLEEGKWSISKDGEIHVEFKDGYIAVYRINNDDSITGIAVILKDGKREDLPKEDPFTLKIIK